MAFERHIWEIFTNHSILLSPGLIQTVFNRKFLPVISGENSYFTLLLVRQLRNWSQYVKGRLPCVMVQLIQVPRTWSNLQQTPVN